MNVVPMVLGGWLSVTGIVAAAPAPLPSGQINHIVNQLVRTQDQATLSGNRQQLQSVYLPSSASAERVYHKALMRSAYIADWAKARQVQFDGVTVHVRTGRTEWLGPDEVKVYGADQAQYRYHHQVGNTAESQFGIGVYHWYVLAKSKNAWYIKDDTFIDPLNQDTRLGGAAAPAIIHVTPEHRTKEPVSQGAARAIRYAGQYCGAAPGCQNDNRYHPHYADYNWRGGDCTNFIAQVLHAGGFQTSEIWHGRDGGTVAWVNAIRLSQYLRRSGMATLIDTGTLPALIKPGKDGRSALDKLRPGDLVGYYETGRVVHFAIVVGFDPDGYPLVISHSADRYRVPWDLGWDRTTRYQFYRVNYPA